MNWDKGYSASYHMTEVNPYTWEDSSRYEIMSGSVNRSLTGLRQSADVKCTEFSQNEEKWIRVYLDVVQGDSGTQIPLFTGLTAAPDKDFNGYFSTSNVQCYSVLQPAEDVYLRRGWFAQAGKVIDIIKELTEPIPAPIVFPDETPKLEYTIVAEDGETNMSMLEKVLASVNWDIRIDGRGSISFGSFPSRSVMLFSPNYYDIIEPEIKVSVDWYSCPNVFMASNGTQTEIVKDESGDSPLSIQNRGRELWMYESNVNLSSYESLKEYAGRRLKEEQRYVINASYNRRYIPDVLPGDIITLLYPNHGLNGDFMITTQGIELGYGARTSESVVSAK